jgi:hypothetical protein
MNKLVKCLSSKYEVSTQVMEKPGDELQFLKRRMVLQHDYRLAIQTHHKHVEQMCKLLGLKKKMQRKKTPGRQELQDVRWHPFVPCCRPSPLPTRGQTPFHV